MKKHLNAACAALFALQFVGAAGALAAAAADKSPEEIAAEDKAAKLAAAKKVVAEAEKEAITKKAEDEEAAKQTLEKEAADKKAVVDAAKKVVEVEAEKKAAEKEATQEAEEKAVAKKVDADRLQQFGSKSRWISYLMLGAQFLPEYEETGENKGLNEQRMFGNISVDGAWHPEMSFLETVHAGFGIQLRSAPVNKDCPDAETTETPPAEPAPESKTVSCEQVKTEPDKFREISKSIVGAGNIFFDMYNPDGDKDFVDQNQEEFGPFAKTGFISREKLGRNNDSLAAFGLLGLRYSYYDFDFSCAKEKETETHKESEKYCNAVPRGSISLSAGRFEDYGGFGETQWRAVLSAGYRLGEVSPIYFGVEVNGGPGPDEYSVVFAYLFQPSKIAGLFAL